MGEKVLEALAIAQNPHALRDDNEPSAPPKHPADRIDRDHRGVFIAA